MVFAEDLARLGASVPDRGFGGLLHGRRLPMRFASFHRWTVLLAVVSLTALAGFAQEPSDDVAAAARKARAEKHPAAEAKAKRVITNDELPARTETPAAPTAATATPTTEDGKPAGQETTAKEEKVKPEDDPKKEAYWRKRFAKEHAKLDQAQRELDVLQRELQKDQVQYYGDPQKALMQSYNRSDISEKTAKIDAKKKEVDDLKQRISDMEDQLRKSGGDPGWAR